MVSLTSVPTFATNWQQKSYQSCSKRASELEVLVTTKLNDFTQGVTQVKPLDDLKAIEKSAHSQTFSPMLHIAYKIALWLTQYIFRSHHAYYEQMLALDLKLRKIVEISQKLITSEYVPLHEKVMAGQLVSLTQAMSKFQIDLVYKDIHAAFSLGKIVVGLLSLSQMSHNQTPASFDELDEALKEALVEIAERASNHALADQIRPLKKLNPVVLQQLSEGTPSLIDLALEDYSSLLNVLYMQHGALASVKSQEGLVGKLKQPGMLAKIVCGGLDDIYCASMNRIGSPGAIEALATKAKESKIRVTHVGVEYASFLKQGGLGEALEGLAEAMQSDGASVRVLFPLYSSVEQKVKDFEGVVKSSFKNATGDLIETYTIIHHGVEVVFIDHEDFALDKQRPNIYDGDIKSRARFARFCQCASSWLYQNKDNFDVVHLHDWHVATIAKTLATDYPETWKEGKIPCVFTAHNNSRAAQGRCCDELAVGAYAYGLALNPMLEALRWSDIVTTVSEVFAREIQAPERGEGLDPVMRRLALAGRLVGILNGSNPGKWDPSQDAQLKKWTLDGTKFHDLSCSRLEPKAVVEKKKLAKQLFAQWIEQQRPLLKAEDAGKQLFNAIDPEKPLFGVITRYDSYQKGLDFYDAMIESTLAEGGQIALIGSQEDSVASKILDALVKKYNKTPGVVIIRDEKTATGKFRFQGGTTTTPAIGSVARLAFDVMFMTPKYEPSGLTQFEGWGYGSLVLASSTGGLKESITTPQQDSSHFTGWLFNRALGAKDLRKAVHEAMNYFKTATESEMEFRLAHIMKEATLYGWSCGEKRISPISQYLAVYAKAIERAGQRTSQLSHRLMDRFQTVSLEPQEALARLNPIEAEMALHAFIGAGNKASKATKNPLASSMPIAYGQGVCTTLHEILGPQRLADGTFKLTVMAPAAKFVSVAIYKDDGTIRSLFPLEGFEGGIWQTGLDLPVGTKYRLFVDGNMRIDPYARAHTRLDHKKPMYSVLYGDEFKWSDQAFMQTRVTQNRLESATILEVYPQTWAVEKGASTWKELAPSLIAHAKAHGYSHIELMGVLNFPFIKSMGYQPTSHFSTDYRLGTPEDFKALVDALHQEGLFVLVDFIPGHVAKDEWGMGSFDGSPLYEISGLQKLSLQAIGFRWGHHMNLASDFVQAHLLSSANWLMQMHVDGLRVDAIRSMLNHHDSAAAKRYLQHLNALVQEYPGAITIAEDYSGSELVFKRRETSGLGFNGRWNVGWKHHALNILHENPGRSSNNSLLELVQLQSGTDGTREVKYLSHDEVGPDSESLLDRIVVGAKSEQMPVTMTRKFAKLATFLALSRLLPGPSLMVMGADSFSNYTWRCADPHAAGEDDSSAATKMSVQASLAKREQFFESLVKTVQLIGEQTACKVLHSKTEQSALTYELKGKNITVLVLVNFSLTPYITDVTSAHPTAVSPLSLRVEKPSAGSNAGQSAEILFNTTDLFVYC